MAQNIRNSISSRRALVTMLLIGITILISSTIYVTRGATNDPNQLETIRINGVELHYVDRGTGDPIVFVHGGLVDYRAWEAQVDAFSQHYRTIVYSRRYNFPNDNRDIRPDHSAIVEAEDLAALITRLKLGRVHVVGASYGAYTALFLAVQHPELVRTLVLAEPPVHRWANDLPGGAPVFDEFMNGLWEPAGQAFRDGETEQALRVTMDYFIQPGAWDQLPDEFRSVLRSNQREWQALTTSHDAFPPLSRDATRHIQAPTLMLTGEQTLPIHQLINDELEQLLPNGERERIPDATHEMWDEYPELCRELTLAFLAKY